MSESESYKLTYFNLRARAEPIRYSFALAGVSYEDVRINPEDWPKFKSNFPYGQLPKLEINGKELYQSLAIARYLARKFKQVGSTDFDAAQCDEIVDAVTDFNTELVKVMYEKDDDKKAEMLQAFSDTTLPKYFGKFTKTLEQNGGKWLVGTGVTWADLNVAILMDALVSRFPALNIEQKYPHMKQLRDSVNALPQIKKWIQTRPVTDS